MTVTPWGDSDQLRSRKLHPIRGASPEAVAESQRERLYGAMVACVYEHGFASTTLAQLGEISGVSSRSFYKLFPDKAACLTATVEALVDGALRAKQADRAEDDLGTQLRADFRALTDAAVTQPAATKLCLVDSFGAGPEASRPVRDGIETYEALLLKKIRALPGREATPEEQITARVGGAIEIFRARLRSGKEAELAGLETEIVNLLLADVPPPEPLRSARLPKPQPEALGAADHAERAIRAFAILVAENGYLGTNVDQVFKRASMSASTFYANFSGKQDLMGAAIDGACAQAVAAVMPAFSRQGSLAEAVRAGFGGLLSFLASRPALTRLVTAELAGAGEDALERRSRGLAPLGSLVENNTNEWATMSPIVYEMIGGGVRALIDETVRKAGAEALPALAPICTYLTLMPFVGPDMAAGAANAEGPRRPGEALTLQSDIRFSGGHTLPVPAKVTSSMWTALTAVLAEEEATAREVARRTGGDPTLVAEQLEHLASVRALEAQGVRDGETVYRAVDWREPGSYHPLSVISTQQVATMSLEERDEVVRDIWRRIGDDVDRALEAGLFEKSVDWHMTRTPMRVDAEGWRELRTLHDTMTLASFEIQERNRRRLEEAGEDGFAATSIQAAFEAVAEPENG